MHIPNKISCCGVVGDAYFDGLKGFRLWCLEPGEVWFLISRDVVFNEKEMPLKNETRTTPTVTDSQASSEEVQIEVENPEKSLKQTLKSDQAKPSETHSQDALVDYQLTRDRERKEVGPVKRFG